MNTLKENEKYAYYNGEHVDILIYYGIKDMKYQFYCTNTKNMGYLKDDDLVNIYSSRDKSSWPENIKSLYTNTVIDNIKMKTSEYETKKNDVLQKLEEFKKQYHFDELKTQYNQTSQAVNDIVEQLRNLMKNTTNK